MASKHEYFHLTCSNFLEDCIHATGFLRPWLFFEVFVEGKIHNCLGSTAGFSNFLVTGKTSLELTTHEAVHASGVIPVEKGTEWIPSLKRVRLGAEGEPSYLTSKRSEEFVPQSLRVEVCVPVQSAIEITSVLFKTHRATLPMVSIVKFTVTSSSGNMSPACARSCRISQKVKTSFAI